MVVLGGAACAVYCPSLNSPFIFDDSTSVTDNSSIVRLWPLIGDSEDRGPLNPPADLPTSGRPLVNLSLAINYSFGQWNPVGYHVFNLIVHVLSAFLLMAIVRRTLCLDYFAGRFVQSSAPLAFFVALLWALHPLQTETVVYVTQRTELMVGFFYLATLYCSLRYWAADSGAGRNTWLALAITACLAGMACKEVMVSAPVIVLLFERTFIRGSLRRAMQKSWPLYVGLFLSWGLLLYLNYNAPRAESAGFHFRVPGYAWWFTQTKVLLMYLKLTVWPSPLSIHYEMPYLETLGAAWPWLASVVLLVIVTLVLLWRGSAIGFVGAWMFLILSPTLVVPIVTEVAAERRMYLPLAALVTAVVVGGYWLVQETAVWLAPANASRSSPRWLAGFAATIALLAAAAFGLASVVRLALYRDPIALWKDALATNRDDFTAHNNLAAVLVGAGRADEAIEHSREALRLRPGYFDAHINLGLALASLGKFSEAIAQYQAALSIQPDAADAYYNLAVAFAMTARSQEAIEHYRKALEIRPDFPTAHNNLAVLLASRGDRYEAMEHYQRVIQLRPDDAVAHANIAIALAAEGRLQEAIEHYQRAVQLDPNSVTVQNNLGNALAKVGRPEEAVAHLEAAVRLKPDAASIHNNLGVTLADLGRFPEAIEQYQQAIQQEATYAAAYFNLAKSSAKLNRAGEALAAAERGLELAQSTGKTALVRQIETWLKNYKDEVSKSVSEAPQPQRTPAAP